MDRNPKHIVKTGEQSVDDPFRFVMSTDSLDRHGDIVRQDGWELKKFKGNPIALFGHDHSFPIGNWKNVRVEAGRLVGELQFAARGTSNRIDEIRSLVEQRVLKAVSVGFRVLEYTPIDKSDPWGGWDITRSELLETSVVSVPAQQDALMAASAELGISRETQKLLTAGMLPTPLTKSQPVGAATHRDYSDLLGAHSDDVRSAKRMY